MRTNMDIENDDMRRALGRYNGSLGKQKYPNLVLERLRTNGFEFKTRSRTTDGAQFNQNRLNPTLRPLTMRSLRSFWRFAHPASRENILVR